MSYFRIILLGKFSFFILFFENINALVTALYHIFHHPGYFTMYLNFVIGIAYLTLLKPIDFSIFPLNGVS